MEARWGPRNAAERGGGRRRPWPLPAALACVLAGCLAPPAPSASAFPSNHPPDEAYRCVLRRLALEDFQVEESSPGERTATALRRLDPGPDFGSELWWRIEVSVATGPDRRTVVETVAGEGPRGDGPWGPPGTALRARLGRLAGECTW